MLGTMPCAQSWLCLCVLKAVRFKQRTNCTKGATLVCAMPFASLGQETVVHLMELLVHLRLHM